MRTVRTKIVKLLAWMCGKLDGGWGSSNRLILSRIGRRGAALCVSLGEKISGPEVVAEVRRRNALRKLRGEEA